MRMPEFARILFTFIFADIIFIPTFGGAGFRFITCIELADFYAFFWPPPKKALLEDQVILFYELLRFYKYTVIVDFHFATFLLWVYL